MQLLVAARQLSDHPLDRQRRTVDLAEIPDLTLATSAIATACFFFAVSNPMNASLYSFMVRPPCMRLGSVRRATLASLLHVRAGRRPQPSDITSSLTASVIGNSCRCADRPV